MALAVKGLPLEQEFAGSIPENDNIVRTNQQTTSFNLMLVLELALNSKLLI